MKQSQLKELVRSIVKEAMDAIGSSMATTGAGVDVGTSSGMSPVMQQKMEREKKKAATNKLKADQKMLKKVSDDEKSLKSSYDLTRRITKPNLKKQIDAQKKALAVGL